MTAPILSLRNISVSFGGKPLFENLTTNLYPRDKVCLVGRNGTGKSTLLKIVSALIEPDHGEYFLQPGCHIQYLPQDVILPKNQTIISYVEKGAQEKFMAEAILDRLGLKGDRLMDSLSGGEKRRVALAHTLAIDADILILDEPTNHLDLPAIEWLEDYLDQYKGALITISHDRTFLEKVSTSMWWLDRGQLHHHSKGFKHYETWSEQILADEERQMERLDTRLKAETEWLHRGVTARRKRNQGRLRQLYDLRQERSDMQSNQIQKAKLINPEGNWGSKAIVEAENISKTFVDKPIIRSFSTRILRGERIGIIGPNGAGKTTLVKMLVGNLASDQGTVKIGPSVKLIYFDQMREDLKPTDTLWQTLCPEGGDQVSVQGHYQHVVGYLKGFLFNEKQIRGQVSILSGGEKNRLALAKALTQSGNLLVLDEPTNDLDMDTLDLLYEILNDYEGTLIIVSHDRDFLDKLTTSIIAVGKDGHAQQYIGGYTDYLKQDPNFNQFEISKRTQQKNAVEAVVKKAQEKNRLSYQQKREWEQLPKIIEELNQFISHCEAKLSDPTFYEKYSQDFLNLTKQLEEKRQQIDIAEIRWLELDEISH